MKLNAQLPFASVFLLIVYGFIVLLIPTCLQGEMSLVSSNPADGQTSVETTIDFSLTFNAPLDTSDTLGEDDDDFQFLSTWLHPYDDVDYDNILFSEDLTTVTVSGLRLQEDTQYNLLLLGAYNTSAEMLDKPYTIHFTTADALPDAEVSGTITYGVKDPRNILVLLFEEGENAPIFRSSTRVDSLNGSYTIPFAPNGEYKVAAIKDNGDGTIAPGEDDMGWYDTDLDGEADDITVADVDLENIDIIVQTYEAITAKTACRLANDIAEANNPENLLIAISSDEVYDLEKNPLSWIFWYWAETSDEINIVGLMGSTNMGVDSYDAQGMTFTALDTNWIDSDAAFSIAQANGGAAFQSNHPDLSAQFILANPSSAALLTEADEEDNGNRGPSSYSKRNACCRLEKSPGMQKAANTSEKALWIIDYYYEDITYLRVVDAETGVFIPPETAKSHFSAVQSAALALDASAKLITLTGRWVDKDGLSYEWIYIYSDGSQSQMYEFHSFADTTFQAYDITIEEVQPNMPVLPEAWIDSDSALAIAEANGGSEYRNLHPECGIGILLFIPPWTQMEPIWEIFYISEENELSFQIDAIRGGLHGSAEKEASISEHPSVFQLEQNYPNPFNAQTAIRYQIPRTEHVTLGVYNDSGQKIRTLKNEVQRAGQYTIIWDGKNSAGADISTGLYLIQLKAGNQVNIRKMLMMK